MEEDELEQTNPFLNADGSNPFAPSPAPAQQPVADQPNDFLYQQFRQTGLRNFNVDLNDLSEADEEDLNKIFRSYRATSTAGMSAFEARTIASAIEGRVPTAKALLDLRDTSLPQPQGDTLDSIVSELDQRQARINQASSDSSIGEDTLAVGGGLTGGFLKGAGGLVDPVSRSIGADDFLPGRTLFRSRIKPGSEDDTFKDKTTRAFLRLASAGLTATIGQEGNPLLERVPASEDPLSQLPTIGRLVVDTGDEIIKTTQSEAGKTYQKEIREAFDSQGAGAAARLAVKNPLTGLATFLPESLGFIAGSGGVNVGSGTRAATTQAPRVLNGAQKLLQTAGRNAPVAVPVAISSGENLGFEVEKFYDEISEEELQLLPAYSNFEADLIAAGKDSSPDSVRAAMKRSSGNTARLVGTASSGFLMTFVPGATTIENAVVNQLTRQAGRITGRQVVTDNARRVGQEAAEAGILRSAARAATAEGITESLEEGIQSGTQSILTQGDVDKAVDDGQFGALLGGLLGGPVGGAIGGANARGGTSETSTDGDEGTGGTPSEAPPAADPSTEPFTAEAVQEDADIDVPTTAREQVRQHQADFPEVYDAMGVEQSQRVEDIYGVHMPPGAVLGVSVAHSDWMIEEAAKIEGSQGTVYPLYSDGVDGFVVDETGTVYHVAPGETAEVITPDLNGDDFEQVAYVATVGVKARLDLDAEAPRANDPLSQIRDEVRTILEVPSVAALERVAQTQADPAVAETFTAPADVDSVRTQLTYSPLPLPTTPFIRQELLNDADNNGVVVSRSYDLNAELGRSAVREITSLGIASVGTVAQSARTLTDLGILNPTESGDVVTAALNGEGAFTPPPGVTPLGTVKEIITRDEIARIQQDNTLAEANVDAIETGTQVDFDSEELVNLERQETLADIANGESQVTQPAAIKPRTSQDTMRAVPARAATGPQLVMQEETFPEVPTEARGVNIEVKDAVSQFNAQWPYEAQVEIFNNIAQYRTAVELGRVTGDVIPIFTDRIKGNKPGPNIMFGLMQRYRLPELLGEIGSLEFAASLVEQTQVKTSPMGRFAKEVRSQYGDTLSAEEVASEAFARALEKDFKSGQVADAVNFLKGVVTSHGGGDLFNGESDVGGVTDGVFRQIMLNAGSLYRAPVKRNAAGDLVPDPGGLNPTERVIGDDGNYERVKEEIQRNPAFGMLAETGVGATLRRTVGSVFRLRDVRAFVQDTVGSNAFEPVYNAFVLGAQTPPTLAARDRSALLEPYDRLYTATRKQLGLSKGEMSNKFDQLIKALHILERNQWMQIQLGQFPRNAKTTSPIPELELPAGVDVEHARATAMNAAQTNKVSGAAARAFMESLWAEHGKADTDAQLTGDNAAATAIIENARATQIGNTTLYAELTKLYRDGLRPIIDQTNVYRREAGVNGAGFENIIGGMGFEFYVPLTDEKTSGEANNDLPQYAAGVFSSTNRNRHTMQGRTTASQHIHAAVIEMLDLSHHEVADSQLLGRLAEFADTEFAFEQANGVLRRATGADILGITFKSEKKGTPANPDFKPGQYKNGRYERPSWRGTLSGTRRNEFAVRRDGMARVMRIADQGTSEAIAARWPINSRGLGANVEVATRTLAASFTTRKPTFWSKQLIRDITSTPVLIGTEFSTKAGAKTLANIAGLMTPRRMARQLRYFYADETKRATMRESFGRDPLFKHFQEYIDNGGLTLFTEQLELAGGEGQNVGGNDSRPVLQRGIERVTGAPAVRQTLRAMDAITNSLENMHRLAAFAALRETGSTAEQAAVAAREIINFGQNALQIDRNAEGSETGRQVRGGFRAMYAFARSGVVGSDRTLNRAIWKNGTPPTEFVPAQDGSGRVVPRNAALRNPRSLVESLNYPMIGLMMAQGAATAALVGGVAAVITDSPDGDDDSERLARKIPAHMWAGNVIIPISDDNNTHIALPTQLGAYQLFHGIGALSTLVANGDISYAEAREASVNLLTANTTPFPRYSQDQRADAAVLKTLSPTLIRPVVSLIANSSDQGSPIRSDSRGSAYDGSAYTRAFGSTPEQYVDLSRQVRETTGVDLSAESIRYLFRSYTGDVGNVTDRLLRDMQRNQDGLDRNTITDGIMGGFVPNTNSDRYYPTAEYWTQKKLALPYVTLLNDRIKEDKLTGQNTAAQLEKQYPNLKQLRTLVARSDQQRSKLNKRKRSLRASDVPDAKRQEMLRDLDAEYRQMYLTYARDFERIVSTY